MRTICFPVLLVAVALTQVAGDHWPMLTQKCYSTLTQPDQMLICPAAKNGYCIKEVSSLTADICGKTQYFGDDYTNSQCEFRKCGDTCTAGTLTFEFEGETYTRTRYCCKNDYCNSAVSTKLPYVLISCVVAAAALFLAM